MSQKTMRRRSFAARVGAVALVAITVGVALTEPASAVPASPAGTAGINAKRATLTGFTVPIQSVPQMTADGFGAFQFFGGPVGDGAIYWSPGGGAWEVHGAILQRWREMGYERGLGYPLTDERTTADGVGRFNHFFPTVNGMIVNPRSTIYWHPDRFHGAHSVYGDIVVSWDNQGADRSQHGYPYSEEFTSDGRSQNFNCPAGNRQQLFHVPGTTNITYSIACWNPANRVVTWHRYTTPI
jgi:uncharacterized protein with LGFP repeats